MTSDKLDTLYWLPMLKSTVYSSHRIIRTNYLGDELTIVDCIGVGIKQELRVHSH